MGRARRWASVALSGLVATSLLMSTSTPVRAEQEVLDWRVNGAIEAGGLYSFGERSSSKFQNYRDMDNGFIGELNLRGEHKDRPFFFELDAKNPARDDQLYDGAFGQYGLFRLDLGWNRVRHDLSNDAQTIFQQSGDTFSLGTLTQRQALATVFNSVPPLTTANLTNIQNTVNGLLRPTELGFNTDVGGAAFKLTPTDDLRFDIEYNNIRREGHRPLGTVIGSPGGSPTELAIPIDNMTHEVKFGAEFARPAYALQFNYTGSIFNNDFSGYTWDNPINTVDNATGQTSRDRIAAAPDNIAHTFSLTGTAGLPLRTRINGTFAYTMLRQDATFNPNTQNPFLNPTNADEDGRTSADAKHNLVLGNIVLTSRPINNVTATARYRYFDYQNDTPTHVFSAVLPTGQGPETGANEDQPDNLRYTKQNAGFDLGWHPIRMLSLKGGYEYEHWNRSQFEGETFSTSEHIGKFAADVTPLDWLLGRVTYTYGNRDISGFNIPSFLSTDDPTLPQSIKFNYAPRVRNRVDALLQSSYWETVTASISGGYSKDDYHDNQFGLLSNDYWTAGTDLDWTPVKWLTIGGVYSYEQYNYRQDSRQVGFGAVPPSGSPNNNWESNSKDEFHNVGVNATVNVIPKKLSFTLGYAITFGYTTIRNTNPSSSFTKGTATSGNAQAFPWDKVQNVLQTARIVGKFYLTEKLSLRAGFAYERYNERDFARDPMQAFMGFYEQATPGLGPVTAGAKSVYLGATVPNYEAYITSFVLRYEF